MTYLKNCRLIPELCEGYGGESADILINGGSISGIYPVGATTPEGSKVVDIGGKTLLPGLIDLHVHLFFYNDNAFCETLVKTPGDVLFGLYEYAMAFARHGYTTIRDCGSNERLAIPLAKAIQRGQIPGPRIIACGLAVIPTETGNDSCKVMYHEADGADGFLKACREEMKYGAKFVKLMASGAYGNEGGDGEHAITTMNELKAAVYVAENKNSYVAAHCHGKKSILMAVQAGARTIEHASFLDEECVDAVLAKGDCYVIPTMSTFFGLKEMMEKSPPSKKLEMQHEFKMAVFKRLKKGYERGLILGWGTDIPMAMFEKHAGGDFLLRKEYLGIDNLELLKQATIQSARIARIDDITGSIKTGKAADLLVVEDDPLEDIAVMTKKPAHVWCAGNKVV